MAFCLCLCHLYLVRIRNKVQSSQWCLSFSKASSIAISLIGPLTRNFVSYTRRQTGIVSVHYLPLSGIKQSGKTCATGLYVPIGYVLELKISVLGMCSYIDRHGPTLGRPSRMDVPLWHSAYVTRFYACMKRSFHAQHIACAMLVSSDVVASSLTYKGFAIYMRKSRRIFVVFLYGVASFLPFFERNFHIGLHRLMFARRTSAHVFVTFLFGRFLLLNL